MASSSATTEVPKNRLRTASNASSGVDSETWKLMNFSGSVEPKKRLRTTSNASSAMDSETGRLPNSLGSVAPKNRLRTTSNASSAMDSDTGRLLNSLGSVGSSLPDVGPALPPALPDLPKPDEPADDENQFQVPASLPQHQMKLLSDESSLHVSFTRPQEEEHASLTSSRSSRHIPERRLPTKKRKMSYESYDSAMGDSYLGLASLDSGMLPKLQTDAGSINTKGSGASSSNQLAGLKISAQDHLDALEGAEDGAELPAPAPVARIRKMSEGGEHGFKDPTIGVAGGGTTDDNSEATFTSSGHRLLMEAIMMTGGLEGSGSSAGVRRNRLESWGGMSDLSVHMGPDQGATAAAIAASALHHTGIIDDVTAAANFGGGSVASSVTDEQLLKPGGTAEGVPTGRERKESTTSFSDSTFPVPSSLDGLEIPNDLQKFVAAAVASVGDQLAELAGNIESAAAAVDMNNTVKDDDTRQGSEVSSIATPLVAGPSLDDPSKITSSSESKVDGDTGNSNKNVEAAAAASTAISVDYDAVAAAVDAANAATGGLDLSAIIGEGSVELPGMSTTSSASSGGGKKSKAKRKRKLPTHNRTAASHLKILGDVPKSSLSEKEQEEIRKRARKAAGYVPPAELPNGVATTPTKRGTQPPLKKRMKKMTPEAVGSKTSAMATPKISNVAKPAETQSAAALPVATKPPKAPGTKITKEKSTAKWDSMYDALIQFIADRKEEETTGQSEEEIAEWVWDGNVPTTYKTKDGKALGRWINNQRSAKSKGTLREERENRLVGAGLKWSVLASNSWNEMLDELRLYIKEFTKDGKKWDGNVPTNYRIKAKANGKKMSEEDKNLGRWVNRQRSLYQAGKLREDRQLALEKVGLKWSMLATTSWEAMFETLVAYVEEKKKKGIKWDGNVPANYKTDDNPPRALGRWINRQRSAHVKKKLKQEYVEKLSKLGLKWSVHERKYVDDSQITTQPKPQGVASGVVASSQLAKIPSTIAVPAKKIDPKDPTSIDTPTPRPAKLPSVRFDESTKKLPATDVVATGHSKLASTSATPAPVKSAPAAAAPKATVTPNAAPSSAKGTPAKPTARATVAQSPCTTKPVVLSATAKHTPSQGTAPTSAQIPAQKQTTSNGPGENKTSLQQQLVRGGQPTGVNQQPVKTGDNKAVLPPTSASKGNPVSTGTPTLLRPPAPAKVAKANIKNCTEDGTAAKPSVTNLHDDPKSIEQNGVKKEPIKPTLLPPASAGTRKPVSMGELVQSARTASTPTNTAPRPVKMEPTTPTSLPSATAATKKPVSMGELVKAARMASSTSALSDLSATPTTCSLTTTRAKDGKTSDAQSAGIVNAQVLVKKESSKPCPTDAATRKRVFTPELAAVKSQDAATANEVSKTIDANTSSGVKEGPQNPSEQFRTAPSCGGTPIGSSVAKHAGNTNSVESAGKKAATRSDSAPSDVAPLKASPTPAAVMKGESKLNACQTDVPLLEKETERGSGDKTNGETEKQPSEVA